MKRRTVWMAGFLTLTAAAVMMELVAANDTDPDTVTWSELVGTYVPQTVGVGAASILAAWIVPHIAAQYGGTMKVKFEPVAWLTGFYTLLGAVLLANEQFGVLPDEWVRVASLVAGALGLWLAARTRAAVTPLADPKDEHGRELVPASKVPPPNDPIRRSDLVP